MRKSENAGGEKACILSLPYLPNLEYLICLLNWEKSYIDIHEHYEKQSYRNRAEILTADGVQTLSVPVQKISGKKEKMNEVRIDHRQKWMRTHWRAICSAYGKSPFFEHYIDSFKPFFSKEYRYLWQFNLDILTICLRILNIKPHWELSRAYMENKTDYEDLRSTLHPKKRSDRQRRFVIPTYTQVFGKGFVANLSVIDLIFCEGPNASYFLKKAQEESFATSSS